MTLEKVSHEDLAPGECRHVDDRPSQEKCPRCGNMLSWRPNDFYQMGLSKNPWLPEDCDACRKKLLEEEEERSRRAEQDRIDRLTGYSRLEKKYLTKTFSNFNLREGKGYSTRAAYEECLVYAQSFPWHLERGSGLLIMGDVGCGKNHLAGAVCHYILREHKKTVAVFKELELLRLIKASWNDEIKLTASKLFSLCIDPDLLIIHDLGIDIQKDWIRRIYLDIIDTRDEKDKPMIITTNHSFKQLCISLQQRTASRLKARFIRVEMWKVPDYREKEGENLRRDWAKRRKALCSGVDSNQKSPGNGDDGG